MSERAQPLFYIEATSRLGRRVKSGPWSPLWVGRKAASYELGGFSDVVIVEVRTSSSAPPPLSPAPSGDR